MTSLRTALALTLFLAGTALAGDLTIQSRLPAGAIPAGTPINPYVVRDSAGRQVGTIRSRLPDVNPHDGILDPGTSLNPWVLHTDD